MKDRFISILEKKAEHAKTAAKKCENPDLGDFETIISQTYRACVNTIKGLDFEKIRTILKAEYAKRGPSFERNVYHNALVLYDDIVEQQRFFK